MTPEWVCDATVYHAVPLLVGSLEAAHFYCLYHFQQCCRLDTLMHSFGE